MDITRAKQQTPAWVLKFTQQTFGVPQVLAGRAFTGRVWQPTATTPAQTLTLPNFNRAHQPLSVVTLEHYPAVNDLRRAAFYPARLLLAGAPLKASVLRQTTWLTNTSSQSDIRLYINVRWLDVGPLLALSKRARAKLQWAAHPSGRWHLRLDETLTGSIYNTTVYDNLRWEIILDLTTPYVLLIEQTYTDTST